MQKENNQIEALITNLVQLLSKGNSHVSLDKALENIPFELLGKTPANLPYTIWQLAQHIRIAQEDILKFSEDPSYQSPAWPEGYWVKEKGPKSAAEWDKCVKEIKADRKSFVELLKNSGEEVYKKFENADGQTLLREALVLADHNSYHTAEIAIVRRLLNDWKS